MVLAQGEASLAKTPTTSESLLGLQSLCFLPCMSSFSELLHVAKNHVLLCLVVALVCGCNV